MQFGTVEQGRDAAADLIGEPGLLAGIGPVTLEPVHFGAVAGSIAWAWPVRTMRPASITAFCNANWPKIMEPICRMPSIKAKKTGATKANSIAADPLVQRSSLRRRSGNCAWSLSWRH